MFTALPSLVRALVVVGSSSSLDMVSACVAVSVFADVMCVCVLLSRLTHSTSRSGRWRMCVVVVARAGRKRGARRRGPNWWKELFDQQKGPPARALSLSGRSQPCFDRINTLTAREAELLLRWHHQRERDSTTAAAEVGKQAAISHHATRRRTTTRERLWQQQLSSNRNEHNMH